MASESQIKAAKKWGDKNLDRMSLAVPKGKKEEIKEAADKAGESVNKYILNAVNTRIETEKEPKNATDQV